MAPRRPFALLISESAALPTIPWSSADGRNADVGVTTGVLIEDFALGDETVTGAGFFPNEVEVVGGEDGVVGGGADEERGLERPMVGEFDGVGFVDLYSLKVPLSLDSPSKSSNWI